jgi:RNA polymerase sigma factor (TIGR02999 family)
VNHESDKQGLDDRARELASGEVDCHGACLVRTGIAWSSLPEAQTPFKNLNVRETARNVQLVAIKRRPYRRIPVIPDHPRSATALLVAWGHGDQGAFDQLLPRVYEELRRLARGYMGRERPGHTLQASALVNEAYLRLIDIRQMQWQNRRHFFAMAARVMRRVLVEMARARRSQKRGGSAGRVSLDEALLVTQDPSHDLVALDEALQTLAAVDARKSQVVEMRFFGGLSVEETAEALQVSPDTVMRDWRLAKVWLMREIAGSDK